MQATTKGQGDFIAPNLHAGWFYPLTVTLSQLSSLHTPKHKGLCSRGLSRISFAQQGEQEIPAISSSNLLLMASLATNWVLDRGFIHFRKWLLLQSGPLLTNPAHMNLGVSRTRLLLPLCISSSGRSICPEYAHLHGHRLFHRELRGKETADVTCCTRDATFLSVGCRVLCRRDVVLRSYQHTVLQACPSQRVLGFTGGKSILHHLRGLFSLFFCGFFKYLHPFPFTRRPYRPQEFHSKSLRFPTPLQPTVGPNPAAETELERELAASPVQGKEPESAWPGCCCDPRRDGARWAPRASVRPSAGHVRNTEGGNQGGS